AAPADRGRGGLSGQARGHGRAGIGAMGRLTPTSSFRRDRRRRVGSGPLYRCRAGHLRREPAGRSGRHARPRWGLRRHDAPGTVSDEVYPRRPPGLAVTAMADLGRFSLLGALVLACYAPIAALLGARFRRPDLVATARRAVTMVALLEVIAAGVLVGALLRRDYAFAYVAGHVRDAQAGWYNLTSFWGGMEGSLLLWALILSGYTLAVLRSVARGRPRLVPGVVTVCSAVSAFFLFMVTTV